MFYAILGFFSSDQYSINLKIINFPNFNVEFVFTNVIDIGNISENTVSIWGRTSLWIYHLYFMMCVYSSKDTY